MANVIVVAVVIVLLGFALKGTLKSFERGKPLLRWRRLRLLLRIKSWMVLVIGKKTVKNFWYALRSLRQSRNRS